MLLLQNALLKKIPEYDKATAGVSIVGRIGLPTLRAKCPHFNEWLHQLEELGDQHEQAAP
ncbi:MAG: DUF4276 family protein [Desulfovibrionaceae bacterium]|nr:DUF4276 family protein [Desulfovibrionaceae bacterium]